MTLMLVRDGGISRKLNKGVTVKSLLPPSVNRHLLIATLALLKQQNSNSNLSN